ncbi:MAG TPA: tail fiber domain-containing protein [Ignavibacteria bacterium]|jgi:hypothetical protein
MNLKDKLKLKLAVVITAGIILPNILYSQNITNTLGITGSFKIKDGAATFFTLTQSNGYVELSKSLKLPATTDLNTGVIYKGTERFIHDYKPPSNIGENTFVGINSGNFTMSSATSTHASRNSAFGFNTLNKNTSGYHNCAFGNNSLFNNTTGFQNSAFGNSSLYNNIDGKGNTAIGTLAMFTNSSGYYNTAVGFEALYSNTTGYSNVAIGTDALFSNVDGGENTAIGRTSLSENTSGYRNTALGYGSLTNVSIGNHITAIGYNSGSNVTTGFNLTLIGNGALASSSGAQNQITLGNFQITSLRCNVQTITSLSDVRDKKNIADIPIGINFIMNIKPRIFNWDRREWYDNNVSDGSKMDSVPTAGFVAQELDEVQNQYNAGWLKLVMKDNPEKWEATYGNLLPVMVKAIQELNEEIKNLKIKNQNLQERLAKLEEVNNQITNNK